VTIGLDEFAAMPKIDAHTHLLGRDPEGTPTLVEALERLCLRWIDLCWLEDEQTLRDQIALARVLCARHPGRFSWATSFTLERFGRAGWQEAAIAAIDAGRAAGAVAVKVWKNIGMTLKEGGRFVTIDDPRFDPVLDRIRANGMTLAAHIGEPLDCWLPLERMTVEANRSYYRANPQYHGLRLPEVPDHRAQVDARDRMLARHPDLCVVGCHLGSLEFDVAEVARRLDRFPRFAVDLAGRVCHLQGQEREAVRGFLIAYQDRVLHGTDLAVVLDGGDLSGQLDAVERTCLADGRYFCTDNMVDAPAVGPGFRCRGLALPAAVIRKIFHHNAMSWYPSIGGS